MHHSLDKPCSLWPLRFLAIDTDGKTELLIPLCLLWKMADVFLQRQTEADLGVMLYAFTSGLRLLCLLKIRVFQSFKMHLQYRWVGIDFEISRILGSWGFSLKVDVTNGGRFTSVLTLLNEHSVLVNNYISKMIYMSVKLTVNMSELSQLG